MKNKTSKIIDYIKDPKLLGTLVAVFWFAIGTYAFSGPPVGCTPDSCPNGPLAQLASGNIRSGVTIVWVTGDSNVVDTSAGDAIAGQILSGLKAYVDGVLVTGTIPSKTTATITPSTTNQTISAGQYLSGDQTIAGDADLTAGNIKSGVNLFGVAGTLQACTTTCTTINYPSRLGNNLYPDTVSVVRVCIENGYTYASTWSQYSWSVGSSLARWDGNSWFIQNNCSGYEQWSVQSITCCRN